MSQKNREKLPTQMELADNVAETEDQLREVIESEVHQAVECFERSLRQASQSLNPLTRDDGEAIDESEISLDMKLFLQNPELLDLYEFYIKDLITLYQNFCRSIYENGMCDQNRVISSFEEYIEIFVNELRNLIKVFFNDSCLEDYSSPEGCSMLSLAFAENLCAVMSPVIRAHFDGEDDTSEDNFVELYHASFQKVLSDKENEQDDLSIAMTSTPDYGGYELGMNHRS